MHKHMKLNHKGKNLDAGQVRHIQVQVMLQMQVFGLKIRTLSRKTKGPRPACKLLGKLETFCASMAHEIMFRYVCQHMSRKGVHKESMNGKTQLGCIQLRVSTAGTYARMKTRVGLVFSNSILHARLPFHRSENKDELFYFMAYHKPGV